MKIYHYDPTTQALIGEGVADADPMVEDGWLIPANATAVEPPKPVQGKFCKFDGSKWSQVDVPAPPVPLVPPVPTFAELKAIEFAKYRADREAMLNRLTGIGLAALIAGDTTKTTALATLRQGLLDLPSSPAVAAATTLDALKLTMKQQYSMLIAVLPPALKIDFARVDK